MGSYYLTLALYAFLIYWLIVLVLNRKGILQRYNISVFGPILMIRTTKGEKLLERLAKGELRERFWRTYANVGTILVLIAMIYMFIIVVVFSNYVMFTVQPEPTELHEPRNWLLIPGLNEFIPLCAWIGLAVALVVHELSHAILSTVEKVKVKSMGLLVLVIPIGAFAEPDSEQLFGETGKSSVEKTMEENETGGAERGSKKVASARERTRILSAGLTSNFVVALIAFALFFSLLFAIQPVSDRMLLVYDVVEGSTAYNAGMTPEMFITGINGTNVTNASIERMNKAIEEKEGVIFNVLDKNGEEREIVVEGGYESEGVQVIDVTESFPADKAGIKVGMSIIKMDDVAIADYRDFSAFMNRTTPGQEVEVQTRVGNFSVVLCKNPHANKGFLGVTVANNPLGMIVVESQFSHVYLDYLRSIPSSFTTLSPRHWLSGWGTLMIMPFSPLPEGGFSTFNPFLSHLYEPAGAASFFGGSIFFIADVLFWTGWINLLVGLFNCLPAIPLDGGYVFREMLNPALRIGIKDEGKKEKISKVITAAIAIFIASSIAFMLIGPSLLKFIFP
jgi:membrane-associated protease RseP (regulator of RpoE activity)